MTIPKIIFVKKIKSDGTACKKCAEVEQRLRDSNYMQYITQTIIADEREADSEGMKLASQYKVERAPFFIVENPERSPEIYTVYFKLVKEVIEPLISNQ